MAVVVVESPLDVLVLAEREISAVATLGAMPSARQIELLARLDRPVVLALDNDEAGLGGTRKFLKLWSQYAYRSFEMPQLAIANYAGIQAKDVGEMTDTEIERCLASAILQDIY